MRLIIDFQSIPGTNTPASSSFLTEMLVEMAEKHTEHQFVFFDNQIVQKIGKLPENVAVHKLNNSFSKWFGKIFWYKFYLPKELKKLQADLFVTVDNFHLKRSSVPACLLAIHGNELLEQANPVKKNGRTARIFSMAIKNATTIMAFSDYDRLKVQQEAPAARIIAVRPQPADIPELTWPEKEISKIDFAAGVEYFAFVGDLDEESNLIELLKAFALFKKWQQSNMQLVIAGNRTSWTTKFSEKLSSFKYRKEVNLLINPSKTKVQKLVGGAYAFISPALYDPLPVNILQAMQVEIPVISAGNPVTREWCEETVMYAETDDAEGFAKCMQLMYKDERQRSDLILAAKKRLLTRTKNEMLGSCMNFLEETVAK